MVSREGETPASGEVRNHQHFLLLHSGDRESLQHVQTSRRQSHLHQIQQMTQKVNLSLRYPTRSSNTSNHFQRIDRSIIVCQPRHHLQAQYHDKQADGDDDEQSEAEPAKDHGGGTDPALDATVAEGLRDARRRDGGRVLPQHRHEHEDGGDEDDGERHLRHGPRGEGLLGLDRAGLVDLLVPSRECGEQQETDEGEDDGDDSLFDVSVHSCELEEGKEWRMEVECERLT